MSSRSYSPIRSRITVRKSRTDSSAPAGPDQWLSKVNDIGMVVDLSHAGSRTALETIVELLDRLLGLAWDRREAFLYAGAPLAAFHYCFASKQELLTLMVDAGLGTIPAGHFRSSFLG